MRAYHPILASLMTLLLAVSVHAEPWKPTLKEFIRLWESKDSDDKVAAVDLLAKADRLESAKLLVRLLGLELPAVPPELLAERKTLEAAASKALQVGATRTTTTTADGKKRTTVKYTKAAQAESAKLRKQAAAVDAKIGRARGLREHIVGALAGLRTSAALRYLRTKALRSKVWAVRRDVLRALGRNGDKAARAAVRGRLKDSDPRVVVAALEAVGLLRDEAARAAVVKALGHPLWQVRSAAIGAITRLGGPAAVVALIEALQKEQGRLIDDIDRALQSLTAATLGGSATGWSRWLESNRARLPEILAHALKLAQAKKKTDDGAVVGKTVGFYGITSSSKRICYVIDVSGSMGSPAQARKAGSTSGPGGKGPVQTKLDVARDQLISAIERLPADTWFNIVYYHTTVARYETEAALLQATLENKRKTIEWIKATLKPMGGTNIHEALLAAFGLAGKDAPAGSDYAQGVDTIFFLTDGSPSAGPIRKTAQIRAEIQRINRDRRITIHCIGVGGINKTFLSKLAAENSGTFVHHK